MINQIKKLITMGLLTTMFISCEKEVGPLSDLKPAIPVTVSNAAEYRPEPAVTSSLSGGGKIQIVLSIPSTSGRSIKEITKAIASASYSTIQGIGPNIVYYNASPIAGAGTSVTFTTTIDEYFVKNPVSAANPAAKANTELARRFYFLITLDDNSVIVTEPVRILVLS